MTFFQKFNKLIATMAYRRAAAELYRHGLKSEAAQIVKNFELEYGTKL